MREYQTFKDFYPFYLSQHEDKQCRRLHFLGSGLVLLIGLNALITQNWMSLWALPAVGYGFAWMGHYFFEKNRPATFTYPIYSLMGDWVMFKDIILGRVKL